MANRYKGWSSQEIEKLLTFDRKNRFVDEVFEEVCSKYPNVIYPRAKRKRQPPRPAEG